jgi:hypothetical protein
VLAKVKYPTAKQVFAAAREFLNAPGRNP